jgi:hypothetical protein
MSLPFNKGIFNFFPFLQKSLLLTIKGIVSRGDDIFLGLLIINRMYTCAGNFYNCLLLS